jgi:hypothetical protein
VDKDQWKHPANTEILLERCQNTTERRLLRICHFTNEIRKVTSEDMENSNFTSSSSILMILLSRSFSMLIKGVAPIPNPTSRRTSYLL